MPESVSMDLIVVLAIVSVCIVLACDFSTGFHHAADIVATAVALCAMQPPQAAAIVSPFSAARPLPACP